MLRGLKQPGLRHDQGLVTKRLDMVQDGGLALFRGFWFGSGLRVKESSAQLQVKCTQKALFQHFGSSAHADLDHMYIQMRSHVHTNDLLLSNHDILYNKYEKMEQIGNRYLLMMIYHL